MAQFAMLQPRDEAFMRQAIALAATPLQSPGANPRVGCVIVKDQQIIGEGYHKQTGGPHAEIEALRGLERKQTEGATAYVTLEPCCHQGKTPPCTDALIHAGISKVVVGMTDPNDKVAGQGLSQLASAGIEVHSGLMQSQAEALNPGFLKRMRQGLPYVRLKLATSIDGRVALANGESKWISSAFSRSDVQQYRLKSDAVMTSSATAIRDNPRLTIRPDALPESIKAGLTKIPRQPVRVLLDRQLKVAGDSQLLSDGGTTWIFHHSASAPTDDHFYLSDLDPRGEHLDLKAVMHSLADKEINDVLVECGGTLAGALLQANLVDELIIYQAPKLLGHTATPMMRLPELCDMKEVIALTLKSVEKLGEDVKLIYQPGHIVKESSMPCLQA